MRSFRAAARIFWAVFGRLDMGSPKGNCSLPGFSLSLEVMTPTHFHMRIHPEPTAGSRFLMPTHT